MLIENDETNDDNIETKEVNEINVNTAMKSLEKRLNYEGSLLDNRKYSSELTEQKLNALGNRSSQLTNRSSITEKSIAASNKSGFFKKTK